MVTTKKLCVSPWHDGALEVNTLSGMFFDGDSTSRSSDVSSHSTSIPTVIASREIFEHYSEDKFYDLSKENSATGSTFSVSTSNILVRTSNILAQIPEGWGNSNTHRAYESSLWLGGISSAVG